MATILRKQGYSISGGGGSTDTSALANKSDLTAIILTGTTNTSGDTISAGTWFYLNGTPCIAKVDIASGATFTEGTNYEEKTIGSALSELNSNITNNEKGAGVDISGYNSPSNSYTFSSDGYIYLAAIEAGASVTAVIGSVTGVVKSFGSIACVYSNGSQRSMTFVRKGMTTYCASGTGNYICQFTPIV